VPRPGLPAQSWKDRQAAADHWANEEVAEGCWDPRAALARGARRVLSERVRVPLPYCLSPSSKQWRDE
jgi:hypothetical protein